MNRRIAVRFGKLIAPASAARSRCVAEFSKPFCQSIACGFAFPLARQDRLTISGFGVGEMPNPQSPQGFFASFEAFDPFVLQQANRKNQNS
jgi:hypothetical protein